MSGGLTLSGDTSGSVKLVVPAVAGTNTVTVPAATGTMLTTASTAVVTQAMLSTNVAGNGPAFSAYQTSAQTLSGSTWTKIQCAIEEFDTNNNYDNSTNYRFTPTIAGYYQVSGGIAMAAVACPTVASIYKNGTLFKYLQANFNTNTNGAYGSTLIYLNGSTDYIELWGWLSVGQTLNATQSQVYFQAVMVRSA